MNFNIGDVLRVDGDNFRVIGKIVFDGMWAEYRLIAQENGQERWLSIDDNYREYSISRKADASVSFNGYHVVDEGTETVTQAEGNVDVSKGDKAVFKEYEDVTTEKIISVERWDDEEEISVGYYLDEDEIRLISGSGSVSGGVPNTSYSSNNSSKSSVLVMAIAILGVFVVFLGVVFSAGSRRTTISEYLKKSSAYTYKTSITGTDNQKADVYYTSYTLDQAAKNIIEGINGKTEDIQQNTEDGDNSIAILTNKEYCIIYTSEDNETLVQVSTREYTYRNDKDLYHAGGHTNRYYRRYYYSRGYSSDTDTYDNYSSPYSSYTDTTLSDSYDSTYNTYSSSIRQSSTTSRTTSGGGLSSGK